MLTPTSRTARERALELLRDAAAMPDFADSESRAAARFLLERWGACRTTAQRKNDVTWCDDPESWCHGRLFQMLRPPGETTGAEAMP